MRIEQFNVNHIRSVVEAITGRSLTVWINSGVCYVAAGEGSEGERNGAAIISACSLPARVTKYEILGSVADLDAKSARGIFDQTFVEISA